ncbi:MAG: EH signature domain-containing protein [Microcoleus sp.]
MSVNFRAIQLPPTPGDRHPEKLKIASSFTLVNKPKVREVKARSLRSLEAIIADIEGDRADNIDRLEWAYCLRLKIEWDIKNPDRAAVTSQAIWQIARNNSLLKQQLLWRVALDRIYKSENPASSNCALPPALAECFEEFANTATSSDALPVQIIKILPQERSDYELAKLSWQYLKTPAELLTKALLPARVSIADRALQHAAGIFAKNQVADKSGVEWLLKCLQEMPPQQQLAAVAELLVKISDDPIKNYRSKLVEWLQDEYSPKSKSLDGEAKTTLNRWIGALNYSYFQKTIDLVARMLKLPEAEIKVLEERRDFWANYSDRIQRVRLLLPQSSASAIGYQLQFDFSILPEDGSELTEVCIFQLSNYCAIEFFRGTKGEVMLIPRSKENDRLLFVKKDLSISRIRQLGGEVHDRMFMWQSSCEKWLKQKGIFPNEGTEYFQGMSKFYGKYDVTNGLRNLEPKEQKEREILVKKWQKEMGI